MNLLAKTPGHEGVIALLTLTVVTCACVERRRRNRIRAHASASRLQTQALDVVSHWQQVVTDSPISIAFNLGVTHDWYADKQPTEHYPLQHC